MGLVACLEPSQRQWPGAANLRREWMSDPPRLPEDLIAARPGQKLSILCLDSWYGTMSWEDDLFRSRVQNLGQPPSAGGRIAVAWRSVINLARPELYVTSPAARPYLRLQSFRPYLRLQSFRRV